MSTADYATHRGVSDSYVRRLRRTERVVLCAHGEIDVAATDALLAGVLHPLRGGDRTTGADAPAAPAPSAALSATPAPALAHSGEPTVHEAVRRERLARARLAELELGEESGELTRRRDVERAVVTLVRRAIARFRQSATSLRARLAASTDPRECERILEGELALICADMQAESAALLAARDDLAKAEAA